MFVNRIHYICNALRVEKKNFLIAQDKSQLIIHYLIDHQIPQWLQDNSKIQITIACIFKYMQKG